jgi:hypothetical protein
VITEEGQVRDVLSELEIKVYSQLTEESWHHLMVAEAIGVNEILKKHI